MIKLHFKLLHTGAIYHDSMEYRRGDIIMVPSEYLVNPLNAGFIYFGQNSSKLKLCGIELPYYDHTMSEIINLENNGKMINTVGVINHQLGGSFEDELDLHGLEVKYLGYSKYPNIFDIITE